ncbi:RGL2 protein, partial [Upupa epops]|nr:RGL2 protein [Upupa epops]
RALSSLLCLWLDSYPEDFGAPQVLPLTQQLLWLLGPDWEGSKRLQALGDPKESPPQPHKRQEEEEEGTTDPLDILGFPPRDVAEQLTVIEADLFLRLIPYECLGSQWSQRGKLGHEGSCPTVRATVHQFNQLV